MTVYSFMLGCQVQQFGLDKWVQGSKDSRFRLEVSGFTLKPKASKSAESLGLRISGLSAGSTVHGLGVSKHSA